MGLNTFSLTVPAFHTHFLISFVLTKYIYKYIYTHIHKKVIHLFAILALSLMFPFPRIKMGMQTCRQ